MNYSLLSDSQTQFTTWAEQYKQQEDEKKNKKMEKIAELFVAKYGFPFAELKNKYPDGTETDDGCYHYLDKNGKEYIYSFVTSKWF